jgi:NADH-quinone oxidoreductase subunit M
VLSLVGAVVSFLPTIPLITGSTMPPTACSSSKRRPGSALQHLLPLGVDGLSLWFVPLTAFITIIVVISAWEVIEERVAQYMGSFLMLSGLMIGVFARSTACCSTSSSKRP